MCRESEALKKKSSFTAWKEIIIPKPELKEITGAFVVKFIRRIEGTFIRI